jgi:ubiquinone/menaquinone biosynthesis C-methylase UbiE
VRYLDDPARPGTPEVYADVERRRYELEPFIPAFADFERSREQRVLEVGVGLGTDFVRFVRADAQAIGIDLTETSIAAMRDRLALEGLEADLRVASAEQLPFGDGEFDLV